MRLWLGAVLVCGLLLGLGSPAEALVIDSFSAGAFNLMGGTGGTTATQVCGSFCFGANREVFIQANNAGQVAFVQLISGEAANVMPDPGGGLLSFSYAPAPGDVVDLTVGATATQSEVWFTAFEPGARMRVTVEDNAGVRDTVTVFPVFSPAPTPSSPGIAVVLHSSFTGVDLTNATAYTVTIDNSAAGDYHPTLIWIPVPATSPAMATLSLPGITMISVPPSPSPVLPIGVAHPPVPVTPVLTVELSLTNASNAAGPISANVVGLAPPDDSRVVFLDTTLPGGPTAPTLQYRFDYLPPPPGIVQPDDTVPVLDWTPGNNWFEIKVEVVDVGIEAGTVNLTIFGETGLNQPINLSNVTAVKGSTLITVELTGPVDGTMPALNMALAGEFTPTTLVPVFAPHDLAPLLLAGLVMAGALVLVTRVRRRGTKTG